jgi:hypothetical protein
MGEGWLTAGSVLLLEAIHGHREWSRHHIGERHCGERTFTWSAHRRGGEAPKLHCMLASTAAGVARIHTAEVTPRGDFITGFDAGSCPLKVLLTSRPEDDILSRICEPRYVNSIHRVNFSPHSKENTSNEDDVRVYIARMFSNYLAPKQYELLVKKANGLFIWASTAQAFIANALDPMAV